MMGHLSDVITYAKFQDDTFRGYDFTGRRISHFPIDFCMCFTTVPVIKCQSSFFLPKLLTAQFSLTTLMIKYSLVRVKVGAICAVVNVQYYNHFSVSRKPQNMTAVNTPLIHKLRQIKLIFELRLVIYVFP